jgi:FAD/FMN-containing dehydrogenase
VTPTSVDSAAAELRRSIAGAVLTPADAGYDDARTLFNTAIDKRPAVIVQVATTEEVARVVAFGRDRGLEIAVRGGGHSVAGTALSDGGLVIDLRNLHTVTVDPEARTATVGGGATVRHLDRATQPHGLATTSGRTSTTGIGGLTLGGGTGWLDRRFGLASDNLVAADLITADGRHLRASDDEHPELFWALHGGGGNFGIVTAFTFRLHPVRTISALVLMWDPGRAPEVLRAYREFVATAPDEIGGAAKFHTAPDAGWVPPDLVGRLACTILVTCLGSRHDAREAADALLRLGHRGELAVEVPYADLQSMLDDPPGHRNHWSAEYLDALPDAAIDLFCARARDAIVPSPSEQLLVPLGGAVARGPGDHPIPWRQASWHTFAFGLWSDPADDERARTWARQLRTDVQPWASGDVYLNFIGDEGRDRVVAGFGASNYARLAEVKAAYDPENVFHLNHNIEPARRPAVGPPRA